LLLTSHNSTNYHFFNNARVQKALNVPKDIGKPWLGCIPGEGRRRRLARKVPNGVFATIRRTLTEKLLLDDDRPVSVVPYIAELLDEAGIQVLVYNGDRDLSTCAQGSETLLDRMKWSGSADWANPNVYRRGLWMVDGQVAGRAKSLKRLDFVVVFNSGHLVPYNQPINALDLITRLLKAEPFVDVDIPVVYHAPKRVKKHTLSHSTKLPVIAVLIAATCGFFLGIVSVFVYSSFQRSKYDRIGDVEIEPQG
jgi:hypothetical protein